MTALGFDTVVAVLLKIKTAKIALTYSLISAVLAVK